MPIQYTRKETLNKCVDALKPGAKPFYQQGSLLNRIGVTKDTRALYTEVIADYILKHLKEFRNNLKAHRTSRRRKNNSQPYRVKRHQKVNILTYSKTNRVEERMAVSMFCSSKNGGKSFPIIGKIIDYQVPLKNVHSDKTGKIDLLSDDGECLRILELKIPESDETMLRCVLEAYSYHYQAIFNKKVFNESFGHDKNYDIKACVFVAKEGNQYKEYFGLDGYAHPKLIKLMETLQVEPIFYEAHYNQAEDRYILDNCITDSKFFPKP